MNKAQRMQHLKEFIKDAKEDWELKVAGQEVQIIQKMKRRR